MRLFVCQPTSPSLCLSIWLELREACGNCSRLSNAALAVAVPSTWHDSMDRAPPPPRKTRLTSFPPHTQKETTNRQFEWRFHWANTNTRLAQNAPSMPIPLGYYSCRGKNCGHCQYLHCVPYVDLLARVFGAL